MSSIMNLKEVRNHPHRAGYDMSFRNCFTAKVGEILPVSCDATLPGDLWSIDLRQFMRTAPVQAATFGRLRQYYDFYFVPLRLLWDKFPAWIVQTKNAYHARDIANPVANFTSAPYMYSSVLATFLNSQESTPSLLDGGVQRNYGARKLLSYLGYGIDMGAVRDNLSSPIQLNPFPLLAYQKIYQDWFRFSQWEEASPWTYNLDYIMDDSSLEVKLGSWYNAKTGDSTPLDLRFCNYDKDMYNGLLPSPQFGDSAIAGPLYGQIPGRLQFDFDQRLKSDMDVPLVYRPQQAEGRQITLQGEKSSGTARAFQNAIFGIDGDNTQYSFGLSVLLLRQAEMRQKWAEITLSGTPDYKEQLAKHWNIQVSDAESYRCQYIGGVAQDIDISEVVNTNLDGENSQAFIAGKGVSASNGHVKFSTKDYGILMCVYHCKPIIDWKQSLLLSPYNMVIDAFSYPVPEFDNVGMEGVPALEFMNPDLSNGGMQDATREVGYAPRYIAWKTKVDVANGAFEHSLSPWIIPLYYQGSDLGDMTYLNFKVPVSAADGIFSVNSGVNDENYETDQLYCTAYFKASLVRNLSRNGLPY